MDYLDSGTVLHGKNYSYRIIRKLGQGSFGITYLASVKMTGTSGSLDAEIYVAVKEFFMKGYNGREGSSVTYGNKDGTFAYYKSKFIHEAENLSRLSNRGIIKVIEQFEENSTAYYVMEYVSEGSLDDCITKNKRFTPARCIQLARGICNALHYMHSRQFLHLDLKPNNIMLRKNGDVVLIDFGLSKRFDANGNPETSTTVGHGTPGYAPLEQQHYKKEPGAEFPATMDIYALGATMFKMLTGKRPPEASSILNEGFPTNELAEIRTPKEIIDVIEKCMSPMKKERYQSTLELGNALKKLATECAPANRPTAIEPESYSHFVSRPKSQLLKFSGIEHGEKEFDDENEWEYDEDTLMGKIERITGGTEWVKDIKLTLGILIPALLVLFVLFMRAQQ